MGFKVKVNYDMEIKEAAKALNIEGYQKVKLGRGVKCYIKADNESVKVVTVNEKLNPIKGCVPVFKLEFDRRFFMYKDTEHIVSCIERSSTDKLPTKFQVALDAVFTVGVNTGKFGVMCGHTFNVDSELETYSMICVQEKPIKNKALELLVCNVYPITEKELNEVNKISEEDRLYIGGVQSVIDTLKVRKFGKVVEDYCDFSCVKDVIEATSNALENSKKLTSEAIKKAQESGGFTIKNGNLYIESAEQFDKFIDIIQNMEGVR